MPTRMIPPDPTYLTVSSELFYAKNLGLLTHWSHVLSLRTIEEMEISGMQLGAGYFLLGLLHIVDDPSRTHNAHLGTHTASAQELLTELLCQQFLCHLGNVGGDLIILICFPHANADDAPEFREAQAACQAFSAQFREQHPTCQFLLLLSPAFQGYHHIHSHYAHLTDLLKYQLFMGQFPCFWAEPSKPSDAPINPQYSDNDTMTLLAGRMATAISRRQQKELSALEEETLQQFFSGNGTSLSPVHFRLYVYLCALLKHLETRGIVDRRFTRQRDFFTDLTTSPSYHDFCSQFHRLILTVLEHYDTISPRSSISGAARLQQIREYCDKNYARPEMTVSYLADLFGISQPQLSASFKRQFGESLLHYLNCRRIDAVKALLTTTKKTQSEIAAQCGFSNVTTMQRLFQRIEHCTPGQYRGRF